MPRRVARFVRTALALGLVLVATGCASDAPLDTFKPEGPKAQTIQDLVNPVFIAGGVVGVLVLGGILVIVLKFRAGKDDDPDELPSQTHGNLALELGWTMFPAVILAFVAVLTVVAIFDLADKPEQALKVDVYGQQWWWGFEYDSDDDGDIDITTANELVIPAGEPAYLSLRSRDVIHSFWIPALNGKKDAVPGRTHDLTIEADEPGVYQGQCTEYCGLSHGNMRMRVIALSAPDYEAWVADQTVNAAAPTSPGAEAGFEIFQGTCTTCHVVNGVNDDLAAAAQVSGVAPNLTHLMSRSTFAGGIFDLYDEADIRDPDLDGIPYNDLPDEGAFNRNNLEAWLRDPPGEKPMAPDPTRFSQLGRGMPNLNLSEQQIDQLVAYLETLR